MLAITRAKDAIRLQYSQHKPRMSHRPTDERYSDENPGVVADLTSLTRRLVRPDRHAQSLDRVGYDPSLPRRRIAPDSIIDSIKSLATFGGISAAMAACLIIGPQHLLQVLKWASIGAVAGGGIVIAFKLLGVILDIAFRVVGFTLIAAAIVYVLRIFENVS
jgi:hypothetical protein